MECSERNFAYPVTARLPERLLLDIRSIAGLR